MQTPARIIFILHVLSGGKYKSHYPVSSCNALNRANRERGDEPSFFRNFLPFAAAVPQCLGDIVSMLSALIAINLLCGINSESEPRLGSDQWQCQEEKYQESGSGKREREHNNESRGWTP